VAPSMPSHLDAGGLENPDQMRSNSDVVAHTTTQGGSSVGPKLLPRETGEDIGMGSPVELSEEAVGIISRLRNMKVSSTMSRNAYPHVVQDEDEDWGRWRDVVFKAKGALRPPNLALRPPPPSNRRKRNKGQFVDDDLNAKASSSISEVTPPALSTTPTPSTSDVSPASETQITLEEALQKVQATDMSALSVQEQTNLITEGDHSYCPECYVPLHPDPKPEKLYIFLHALRYTLSLGTFTAEMPEWASEDFVWDQS
jgi:tRNA pseudouridine32 synthase